MRDRENLVPYQVDYVLPHVTENRDLSLSLFDLLILCLEGGFGHVDRVGGLLSLTHLVAKAGQWSVVGRLQHPP